MSALAVIEEAAACGVLTSLNGGALAIKASGKPSVDLLAELRKHKREIVALLRQEPPRLPGKIIVPDSTPHACRYARNRHQSLRPTGYSDDDWLAAIADAARLGYGRTEIEAKGAGQ
jgi:hypothetical protein